MKSKEYVLLLLDDVLDDYANATDDVEKLIAAAQLSILAALLEFPQLPLRLQLRLHQVSFEIMIRELEAVQFVFE